MNCLICPRCGVDICRGVAPYVAVRTHTLAARRKRQLASCDRRWNRRFFPSYVHHVLLKFISTHGACSTQQQQALSGRMCGRLFLPAKQPTKSTTCTIIPVTMGTRCFHKNLKFQRYPPEDFCTARYERKSSKNKLSNFQKPRKK